MNPNPEEIVTFQLYRTDDESGVSGTGTVAVGTKYPEPNGKVTLAWLTDTNSVATYDSLEDVRDIHGHDGKTTLIPLTNSDIGPIE